MEKPVNTSLKQLIPSLIINGAMAIYALCTFISALSAVIVWRILLSGTGLIFFVAASVSTVTKMLKLRNEQNV